MLMEYAKAGRIIDNNFNKIRRMAISTPVVKLIGYQTTIKDC